MNMWNIGAEYRESGLSRYEYRESFFPLIGGKNSLPIFLTPFCVTSPDIRFAPIFPKPSWRGQPHQDSGSAARPARRPLRGEIVALGANTETQTENG
jgi:hypothetical protein